MLCPVRNDTRAQVGLPIAPEIDDLADLSHGLQKARVFMHHERNARGARSLDDRDAILKVGRERLLHDRRELAACGEPDEIRVRFHRRRDINKVEPLPREHLGRVAIKGPSLVAFGGGARLFKVDVTDRRQHDVVHA